MMIPFLRTPFNYDTMEASNASGIFCDEPGVTQQEFKEECDINEIVRRFGLTGDLPEDVKVPVSGDFTDITDFSTAMQAVRKAQEDFMELPAELRARFLNDPQRLMEFCADGRNFEEAQKLGLLKPDAKLVVAEEVKPPQA